MKQTAVEWLEVKLDNIGLNADIIGDYIQQAKEMEEQNTIEILETYHNGMFNIPLKDGEAKRIVEHIKMKKAL